MTNSSSDSPIGSGTNTCANCFAEFEWDPTVVEGKEYCCTGCADGGPCICTYGAPVEPAATEDETSAAVPRPLGVILSSTGEGQRPDGEETEDSDADAAEEPVAAETGGGQPPEPPEEPPAPEQTPADEPPADGRLAIIMAAIDEMPLPVQEVVRARLSNEGTEEEIGEPLGLTGEEVRELIEHGQRMLDRTLDLDFEIRYVGADEVAAQEEPEPETTEYVPPPIPELLEEAEQEEESEEEPERSELSQSIAQAIESLTNASTEETDDPERSRQLLAEALREAANLFRLASERLGDEEDPNLPLRYALADVGSTEEPITLIIEQPADVAYLLLALQRFQSVRWAKLQSQATERAELRLVATSMMGFIREIMAMEGSLRPTRLETSGNEITVEFPSQEPGHAPGTNGSSPGTRYELSVDSFFGARHFIESDTAQGPPHHHSYRVEATFVTSQPGGHGFVVGFANIREMVDSVTMVYSETLLNTEDPFRDVPPTTENLARVLHEQVAEKLEQLREPSVTLDRVRVWESPTNSATYSGARADVAVTR